MEQRIETILKKTLIGQHMKMSLADNQTSVLWQKFMPRRNEIQNRKNSEYISMQVFEKGQTNLFAPTTQFMKWAAVEVSAVEEIPIGMEKYSLKGGKYIVFIHEGPASKFPKTMQFVFEDWFPKSSYQLDSREHFEVLPENYNPVDAKAREEIWLPIRLKD